MDGVSPGNIYVILGFLLTFGGVVFGIAKQINATADAVRAAAESGQDKLTKALEVLRSELCNKIDTAESKAEAAIVALRTETGLMISNVQNIESRARHDQANVVTAQMGKMELAIKDMARKEDFLRVEKAVERLTDRLGDQKLFESKVDDLIKRIDRWETSALMPGRGAAVVIPAVRQIAEAQ